MSRGTSDTARCLSISLTRLSLSLAGFPKTVLLSNQLTLLRSITPACTHAGLGSFLFARRYSGNRIFSFSSSGYLDVSVPRVPHIQLCIHCMLTEVYSARFPHSEISGSMDICSSPLLIAAYRVLHRLLVPRHPPYALYSLISLISINREDLLSWFIIIIN